MRKKKRKKRTYTPEQLEKMREHMARVRALKGKKKGNDNATSQITSAAGTDLREVRAEVGGETSLRQQGETPGESEQPVAQPASEQASNGAKEALKLSAFGTVPSCDSPEQRKMLVHKLVQNDRMLIARDIGTELDRHVWVGDNHNFVPGMPLNAVPHPAEPAFWKLVGSLPQSKGRW
jgi:hypothetical protein